MHRGRRVALILPARDEAAALPAVLAAVPGWVDEVVVADNGSRDATARVAREGGARVVSEPRPGYGAACLAGLAALAAAPPEVVAFADADGSDELGRLGDLVDPVVAGSADLALERRVPVGRGALSPAQRFGNRLATALIRRLWGVAYADLGPMRALAWEALGRLGMTDAGSGWTVQMQVRAAALAFRVREVDLPYRPRCGGRSKISRSLLGSARAGAAILSVIGREAWARRAAAPRTAAAAAEAKRAADTASDSTHSPRSA